MGAKTSGAGFFRYRPLAVVVALCASFVFMSAQMALAQAPSAGAAELVVHGTMDWPAFKPLATGFRAIEPRIRVRYEELNSIELNTLFLDAARHGGTTADLVMSSAIDLQMKLVNDGHAVAHRTMHADALPQWAIWRQEAFAFAYEPVVTVYNSALLEPDQRPTNRYRLVEMLRSDPQMFNRRVGAYDPVQSGTGYLYITLDMEHSPIAWDLMRSLGEVGVRLYSTSSSIIDAVASGELLIGYNVVGSYAYARAAAEPTLDVVAPEDYTLVVSRTAFISRHGKQPSLARRFLDFLLSREGQMVVAGPSGLFPIRADVGGESMAMLNRKVFGGVRPVPMSPGLLVYVDRLKREKVLRRWNDAMLEGAPLP